MSYPFETRAIYDNSSDEPYSHCGNKCGHNPKNPQFYQRPTSKKKTYDAIQMCLNGLRDLFYWKPWRGLGHIRFIRKFTFHFKKQQRSESREAVASVAGVMVDHCNLATMEVVQKTNEGKYIPLRVTEIAKLAMLSYRRTLRALKVLRTSEYIETFYPTETKEDGSIRSLHSIQKINPKFFFHLGVSVEKFHQCCDYAKKIKQKLDNKTSSFSEAGWFVIKKLADKMIPKKDGRHYSCKKATSFLPPMDNLAPS